MIQERVVIFRVQEEEYAVEQTDVRGVIEYRPAAKFPMAPYYIEDIINLDGQPVPVIRLAAKFGLVGDNSGDRRVLILTIGAQEIGIVVDEVVQVCELAIAGIEPVSAGCDEPGACIKGIGRLGNRFVILLDSTRLFSDDEQANFRLVRAKREQDEVV